VSSITWYTTVKNHPRQDGCVLTAHCRIDLYEVKARLRRAVSLRAALARRPRPSYSIRPPVKAMAFAASSTIASA
jgi:hypothetical protein